MRDELGDAETRRLVLLRHGRSAWNAVRRIQGQSDPPLDETGHEQARNVAPAIAKLEPRLLWSSDLTRARQTATYVADETGLEPSYDARLREFHLGEIQGLTHEDLVARDPAEYARFRSGDWDAIPAAETRAEAAARFTAALGELAGLLEPGETAVVVSHGAAIRNGVAAMMGWPLDQGWDLRGLGNCCWAELEDRDPGRWVLAAYNRAT